MTEETPTSDMKSLKTWMYALSAVCVVLLISSVYLLFKTADLKSSGSLKIGYVRSEQLLQQYKPALAVQQKLQQETADAQKDLEKRYKELQTMDADIKKKSEVLTMQALAPQIEKMQRKQNEFLQLQQSIQQAVQQKQSELLEPIFQDVSNFINKYGRDKGYAVVFGTPVEGIIVYGDPANDLTETIITELNARIPPTLPVPYNQGTDSTKK
jgi:outer membrane protein